MGYLARRLDPSGEFTDDHGPIRATEDILNLELDGLRQNPNLSETVRGGLTPGLVANPGEHTVIALDLEAKIVSEQGGETSCE
jgi:hypothetical protein